MGGLETWLIRVLLLAGPILLAVTVHEFAHGYAAFRMGDPTAKAAGRLTMNPLRHLDLVGTLVFIISGMIGWAKPVPIDARNFRNPRQGMLWASLAGPAANLVTAFIAAQVFKLLWSPQAAAAGDSVLQVLYYVITLNLGLAVFNLVPIPPLDGSHVLSGLLPLRWAMEYERLGRYGAIIILAAVFLPSLIPGFPYLLGSLRPIIAGLRNLMLG